MHISPWPEQTSNLLLNYFLVGFAKSGGNPFYYFPTHYRCWKSVSFGKSFPSACWARQVPRRHLKASGWWNSVLHKFVRSSLTLSIFNFKHMRHTHTTALLDFRYWHGNDTNVPRNLLGKVTFNSMVWWKIFFNMWLETFFNMWWETI